jgi:starch synthase
MKNKIIFAAAECAPFAKVGGLADVIGSLPKALKEIEVDVSIVLPFYDSIEPIKTKIIKRNIEIFFNQKKETFDLHQTFLPESDVPLFLIKKNKFFRGGIYSDQGKSVQEKDFEATRFFFFMQTVTEVARLVQAKTIHCHDWQTSLIPLLIKQKSQKIKTILTIHNIAHQGVFDSSLINQKLETKLEGKINCLRNGINNTDFVTTVSSGYAKEILSPEFGFGLEKDLKKRKKDLYGIINGIDDDYFNPEKDSFIAQKYSLESLADKKKNKEYLQKKFFKKHNDQTVVIGMVSRIAEQKGFDLIEKIFPSLVKKNIQLIILGKGLDRYEKFLINQQKKHPEKIHAEINFDEKLAHQIYAGSDLFLMPSFFEPCGLGQMIALKYGTIPIVRETGGLKDTVQPTTGFLFKEYDAKKLLKEIEKALAIFKNQKKWQKIQKKGMSQDFSWKNSAKKYLKIYNL